MSDAVVALSTAMREVVGAAHVLIDDDVRAGYETDWTRRFTGRCDAVVRPADTTEVAAVLSWCSAHGVVVVPQGGNTGLVGGSVPSATPARPTIVLSTARLTAVGPLDPTAGQLTVGAGVTLASVCDAVAGSPWDVGVDLGARGTATIGGMVATNAGGTRVVRHGMMRRNVAGVEAVLADGSLLDRLGGLEKDNTGYDLTSLLCGSEGTLGIITRVRLRLVPRTSDSVVALVACQGWREAVDLATQCRLEIDGIEGLEAVDDDTAALVGRALDVPLALRASVTLLILWAGRGEPPQTLASVIGDRPHVVAVDDTGQRRLWATRDRATEAIATVGIPHKFDVTLPLAQLGAFVDAVDSELQARPDIDAVHVFGHVGDGNLHLNVLGPPSDDDTVDAAVLALVAEHAGSISAEHGIGRLKQPYLHLARTPAEIAAFRAIKAALDPTGTLNPGVLLPD